LQILYLEDVPPTRNESERVARGSQYQAGKLKKKWTDYCKLEAETQLVPFDSYPIYLFIQFGNNGDHDNTEGVKKYILDGLVKAEILPDDSLRYVGLECFHHFKIIKKSNERFVTIYLFNNKSEFNQFVINHLEGKQCR